MLGGGGGGGGGGDGWKTCRGCAVVCWRWMAYAFVCFGGGKCVCLCVWLCVLGTALARSDWAGLGLARLGLAEPGWLLAIVLAEMLLLLSLLVLLAMATAVVVVNIYCCKIP